jgi:hypothetical protein
MSYEQSPDWRFEVNLTRFPEDNEAVGIAKDALSRTLTEQERYNAKFVDVVAANIGHDHPWSQGDLTLVRDADGSIWITKIPFENKTNSQ